MSQAVRKSRSRVRRAKHFGRTVGNGTYGTSNEGAVCPPTRGRSCRLWVLAACAFGMPAGAQLEWELRTGSGPAPSTQTAMCYDSGRSQIVLFRDRQLPEPAGQTWIWDGASWTMMHQSHLDPSVEPAMAYDEARSQVVLFGGLSGGDESATYVWNGSTWSLRTTSGPLWSRGHAIAYDAARGNVILFGGHSGSATGFTWAWNGTAWTLRSVPGPSPRWNHAMAYDRIRQEIVLFGGSLNNTSTSGETWVWNGTSWTRRAVTGPSARYGHKMVFDSELGCVILVGGQVGSQFGPLSNETWAWDGSSWTQLAVVGPSARALHSMAYDAGRHETVLFGGFDTSLDGETWVLAPEAEPCPADLSGSADPNAPTYGVPDGSVDSADFFYFLDAFSSGNLSVADVSGSSDPNDPGYGVPDGMIDSADFFFFLDLFVTGCP